MAASKKSKSSSENPDHLKRNGSAHKSESDKEGTYSRWEYKGQEDDNTPYEQPTERYFHKPPGHREFEGSETEAGFGHSDEISDDFGNKSIPQQSHDYDEGSKIRQNRNQKIESEDFDDDKNYHDFDDAVEHELEKGR